MDNIDIYTFLMQQQQQPHNKKSPHKPHAYAQNKTKNHTQRKTHNQKLMTSYNNNNNNNPCIHHHHHHICP
jgi:hypothetical protein